MAAFAIAMALAFATDNGEVAARPLVKAAVWLGAALAFLSVLPRLRLSHPWWAAGLLLGVLVLDLAWNNGPSESTGLPPATYDALNPETRNETLAILKERLGPESLHRVELTGLGFHWPNASLVHRLHNVLGYNPVRLALYTQATGAGDHVAVPEQRTFSALFPSYRSKLADLLGLRYIATGVPIESIDRHLEPGDLTLVARTSDGYIYENPRALPRVLFARQAVSADQDLILRTGEWPEVDFMSTVLLDDQLPGGGELAIDRVAVASVNARSEVAAIIESYRNTEVVVSVLAESSGYVVLNDPYHPWWKAEVDGREVPVLRANVLFRAVRVGPGAHRVRFVFRPFGGAWSDLQQRWPVLARFARLAATPDGRPGRF